MKLLKIIITIMSFQLLRLFSQPYIIPIYPDEDKLLMAEYPNDSTTIVFNSVTHDILFQSSSKYPVYFSPRGSYFAIENVDLENDRTIISLYNNFGEIIIEFEDILMSEASIFISDIDGSIIRACVDYGQILFRPPDYSEVIEVFLKTPSKEFLYSAKCEFSINATGKTFYVFVDKDYRHEIFPKQSGVIAYTQKGELLWKYDFFELEKDLVANSFTKFIAPAQDLVLLITRIVNVVSGEEIRSTYVLKEGKLERKFDGMTVVKADFKYIDSGELFLKIGAGVNKYRGRKLVLDTESWEIMYEY